MSEAADAAGTDSISGSQPLLFLALTAALFGMVGAVAVLASHASSRPSGVRGILWNVLRGQSPSGPFNTAEAERKDPVDRFDAATLNEAFVRTKHSDEPALTPPSAQSDPAGEEIQVTMDQPKAVALLDEHRLKLMGLINKVLPSGHFCTSQVPLSRLLKEDVPEAWNKIQMDFVLIEATTGQPALAILLMEGPDDPLLGQVSNRLASARIGVLGFHKVPSAGELKSKIKRSLA